MRTRVVISMLVILAVYNVRRREAAMTVRRASYHVRVQALVLGVTVATAAMCARNAEAQCQYQATVIAGPDCPPLGIPPTRGKAINERGDVAGFYYVCTLGPHRAFVWTAESGLVPLNIPGASESVATDMSGDRVVGYVNYPDDQLSVIAFLRTAVGLTIIPPPPGGTFSQAFGVNDRQQVVGSTSMGGFVWENGDLMIIEPFEPGEPQPRDVNNAGQVVGWAGSPSHLNPTARGFIWEDGAVTLFDAVPGGVTSVAKAINNNGQVVGKGFVPGAGPGGLVSRAYLWTNGNVGDVIDLGTLPGFDRCSAFDINDYGAVIGECDQSFDPSNNVQFLWQHGAMWRLSELVQSEVLVTITQIGAINNRGQITGVGLIPGATVALLLTPIDPPQGDLDIDCRVGIVDLLSLLGNWGPCVSEDCRADLNGDATVDVADFWILILNWTPNG